MRGLSLIVTAAAIVSASCAVAPPADPNAAFRAFEEKFVRDLMAFYPEWAVQVGEYKYANDVTIPDAAWQQRELDFLARQQQALARFDPARLDPLLRADHGQIDNFLKGSAWRRTTLREWEWNPALPDYNPANVIDLVLNTEVTTLEERLRIVAARVRQVPALYAAVHANIRRPSREHTQLAIRQHQGALALLGDDLAKKVAASTLDAREKSRFEDDLAAARKAIES